MTARPDRGRPRHLKRPLSARMRIAASLSASHNRLGHSSRRKGIVDARLRSSRSETLATETTAFEIAKRIASYWAWSRFSNRLTTTEQIGIPGDRDRDTRDREDDRGSIDPRDVFSRDLDLPRGPERELVRDRDHDYRLNGSDTRTLSTVGAFRVVSERDLRDPRDATR